MGWFRENLDKNHADVEEVPDAASLSLHLQQLFHQAVVDFVDPGSQRKKRPVGLTGPCYTFLHILHAVTGNIKGILSCQPFCFGVIPN